MKKVSLLLKLFVSISLVCLCTVTVYAATLEVGEGKPYTSIQTAINDAVTGDTVLVYDGTYVENISFMGKAITVKSVNGAASTTIDGNASGSVVTFNNSEGSGSVLDGFTVTNGYREEGGDGGGIYCYSSSPSITNCIITGNTVTGSGGGGDEDGGGIYCYSSSPSITNCTIAGNTARVSGGGIYCYSSSPNITNCTITGNTAAHGVGIWCAYSSPSIINCTIAGNTATSNYGSGGGISCATTSSPSITNCTIAGNTAGTNGSGGGIYCSWYCYPSITNCTIAGNTAGSGGGMYFGGNYSSPTITNCTITGNTASSNGGGIYIDYYASPTVKNSILWDDSAANGNEIYLGSSTITVTYSDVDEDGYEGSNGNIRQDPLFVDPANGNFRLQPDSPCIDAGTSNGAPSTDMNGFPRYDAPLVPNTGGGTYPYYDIGAYEYTGVVTLEVGAGKPYISIQTAIDDALTGDTVLVYDGIYVELISFMGKAITVRSVNGAASTIINGNASGTVVTFGNGEDSGSVLDGFTITNGNGNLGGGIYCYSSSPTITNCTITGNAASPGGGGIYCASSSPTITNCTITGNTAEYYGGGIFCYSSSPSITNCTIAGNTAGTNGSGGGIYCYLSSPTVENSILWADIGLAGDNEIALNSSTITVTYSDVDEDGYGDSNGNIRQDPLFVDPLNGNFHLQPDTPCIDAGTSDGAPTTDMEGLPRYDEPLAPNTGGGAYPYYDMGAYESQAGQVVRVTSPEGGDVLTSGRTHVIEWITNETESPVSSVRLFYSEDDGMSWKPIRRTITGNPGWFSWRVPWVSETKIYCKVKVELRDKGGMIIGSDESAGSFAIEPRQTHRRLDD
jgi:parallel beta-helix repeat protein